MKHYFSVSELEECVEVALRRLVPHLRESIQRKRPVVAYGHLTNVREELRSFGSIAKGGMSIERFEAFLTWYLNHTVFMQHPHYMALQGAVPHHLAAVGDFVKGIGNCDGAVYELGPATVAMELEIINWMLSLVGWPEGDGLLTHGGTLGNLTALLSARARACPEAWSEGVPGSLAVLVPKSTHYSVARAVAILGMGSRAVAEIPVDARDVLRPESLEDALGAAHDDGRRVIALVANASTTVTGMYDPLEEVGHFCREHEIWFHVDGAHGAAAIVSERTRRLMKGIELADSLVWDGHKMLQTSGLCTAVLYRDSAWCAATFSQEQSYLDPSVNPERPNLYERTFECTKGALSLKLYPVLTVLGEEGIAAHVEKLYDRTASFYRLISGQPGFECPYEPESNVLCFRYLVGADVEGVLGVEANSAVDELQRHIRAELLESEQFQISLAELEGRAYLKLVIMNPRTDESVIIELLGQIEQIAASATSTTH